MQASQLRLDHYYLEELQFSLDEDYLFEENEPVPMAEDLDVTVESSQNPDDLLQWYFKLRIQLADKDSKFPYTFSIRMMGLFEVSKDCPTGLIDQLAQINGPSILYAAARELLAITTARSRCFSILLPSVRFFAPSPQQKAIEAPAEKSQASGLAKRPSQKGRSRKAAARKK